MSDPAIPSTKPFLMRAIYEWCVDSGFTPYVSVVVDSNTRVPMEYVRNGEIVLNIGPMAANKLAMGNEFVEFQARFGGVARDISIPIAAVSAIYARENGHGMSFEMDAAHPGAFESAGGDQDTPSATETDAIPGETPPEPPRPSGRPTLRRVK